MFLSKDSKSPFYQITYFVDGKRTKKSTKTSNKKEAQKFLDAFKFQLKLSEHQLITLPLTKHSSISLSKFEEEYLKSVILSKSRHYIRSVKLSFKHFKKFIGDIPLHKIEVKQIDNFINSVYSRSESGASLYYRTLKAAFSKAVIWNYLSDNPLKKIKAPKVPKSNPIFINEEELNLILEKTTNQNLKNIFTVAFYTGMRLAEILNMKSSWIDTQQNIITLKNSIDFTTKSKKERIIPIHPRIASIVIKQNSNADEFIFNRKSDIKFNEDFVSKQFKKALRAANLNDDIHFHTLRHSFASNLVQRGVNLYVVKELLGHEDIKTTQTYSHLTQSSLSNAVCLL